MQGKVILGVLVAVFCLSTASLAADSDRKDWGAVADPTFVSIDPKSSNPKRIAVSFNLITGSDGADKAIVEMFDSQGELVDSRSVGKSKRETKSVEFEPGKSGRYYFIITAARNDESATKMSEKRPFEYSLPLDTPLLSALNTGGGSLALSWNGINEAEYYEVVCTDLLGGSPLVLPPTTQTETVVANLVVGRKYGLSVTAVRGAHRSMSAVLGKTVRKEAQREWRFTCFGQSSKTDINRMEMIDSDLPTFRLFSCTYNPSTSEIDQKGGKFTAFHDGISFYYTEIDALRENFELTATFTIDYINITADGQEGFGLLVMDSLGQNGVSMVNHYTNSAGIIATKFEEVIGGTKKTSKDTLGARFVSGITPEVLALGDGGIAQEGRCVAHAFSYDPSDLVEAQDVYTLTLKKTNTGYHAIFAKEYAGEDTITEYTMYGTEKLMQLDEAKDYVGFAVARGCNVTVSDVSFTITDAQSDPPAQPEPPELIPLQARVDSPSTYVEDSYPFVFIANADGDLRVEDTDGNVLINNQTIVHDRDLTALFPLKKGINDYIVTFTPEASFRPGERQVMAAYDRELKQYVESYAPVTIMHTVIYLTYAGSQLHVSPNGSPFGRGTVSDPLDLASGINYAKPGQPIVLAGGTYYPTRAVIIERGNNGNAQNRKILRSAAGERSVLDFSGAQGGMQVWGDYWLIEGIDVCNTPYNVKGLQISGNHNIVSDVWTYRCGDTGLQISGNSGEPFEKWPADNLILNCTSHDNCDPAANNADGFAAKLTCGEGNVFRGCIGYSNIDDGWDLFTKIESGPIGVVTIDSCVAYKNGSLSDGSGNGDGNGFKLGGDGIEVAHVLRNSIAYANGASGITSNSNPAIILENNTSYGNNSYNISLYGKSGGIRSFIVKNTISIHGSSADNIKEMPSLVSPDNYFHNGAQSHNSRGEVIGPLIFLSTDTSIVPGRKTDGSIDMKGLLQIIDEALAGYGARF
ncbi:MAG: pectate lyase [Sphaerochaetaceae bacterium]